MRWENFVMPMREDEGFVTPAHGNACRGPYASRDPEGASGPLTAALPLPAQYGVPLARSAFKARWYHSNSSRNRAIRRS